MILRQQSDALMRLPQSIRWGNQFTFVIGRGVCAAACDALAIDRPPYSSKIVHEKQVPRLGKVLTRRLEKGSVLGAVARCSLRRNLWEFGVVVLRTGHVMNASDLEKFARDVFGNDVMQVQTVQDRATSECLRSPGVAVFGNPTGVVAMAAPFDPEARVGTHMWHVDKQFLPKESRLPDTPYVGIMHMVKNAYHGHTTSFADMQKAYLSLTSSRRAWWSAQEMWHLDPFDPLNGSRYTCRREVHRLVRRHAFIGTSCLQIGPSAERSILVGMENKSQEVQETCWRTLMQEAVSAADIYHHVWEEGDLVLWDNSQLLHRSNPYDKSEHVRIAMRVGVICNREDDFPAGA